MKPKKVRRLQTNQTIECPDCLKTIREFAQSYVDTFYCGKCGKLVVDAAHSFCGWCGEKIDWD